MGAKGKKVKIITTDIVDNAKYKFYIYIYIYNFIICFVVNNFKLCQSINHLDAHKFITFSTIKSIQQRLILLCLNHFVHFVTNILLALLINFMHILGKIIIAGHIQINSHRATCNLYVKTRLLIFYFTAYSRCSIHSCFLCFIYFYRFMQFLL